MTSYSQAGQDLWVLQTIGKKGVFFDIGSSHPVKLNNTYLLELKGWEGLCFDNDPGVLKLVYLRRAPLIFGNAVDLDWPTFSGLYKNQIDYLSLDVDGYSIEVLKKLLAVGLHFRCATIEHDEYRDGPERKLAMRQMLINAGYILVKPEVSHDGCAFEDWWTDQSFTKPVAPL